MPDRPEHHYQYDPAKSEAYTATTLAWMSDPGAARSARTVSAASNPAPKVPSDPGAPRPPGWISRSR